MAAVSELADARPMGIVSAVLVTGMGIYAFAAAGAVPAAPWLLAGDLLTFALLALLSHARSASRLVLAVSLWYPLLLIPEYYGQLGVLALAVGRMHDGVVQGWELALFGSQVSVTWRERMPDLVLSSVLHACYAAHYFIFLGVPVWLYVRQGRQAAVRALFAITLAFYCCYAVFALFPVAGPYYAFARPAGPAASVAPARLVHLILDRGASYGTAFPSSHVAASWCAVLVAVRDARRLALGLAPVALGLALGTVYGQFHYGVDALAGAVVAVAAFLIADPLRGWLAARARPAS
jgi:membrane-associated phospholipid phosphatase